MRVTAASADEAATTLLPTRTWPPADPAEAIDRARAAGLVGAAAISSGDVALLDDAATDGELHEARGRLGEKRARLVVALHRDRSPSPWVRRLLEGGWCVLHEPAAGDPRPLLVARPAEVTIRAHRAGDEAAILDLFPPSFHVHRGLDHWRWKYLEHPWGERHASLAFSAEGELLAQYAGYPARFWERHGRRRRVLAAIQVGDLMSAPRARQRGRGATSVFGRCQRHFFATFGEQRVAFLYGFNTATSRAFALRYSGGRDVEPVPLWQVDPARLRLGSGSGGAPYRVETLGVYGRELDRFFRTVAPSYRRLGVRSARYLAWRFARPDRDYVVLAARRWTRLVGWAAFAREGDRILWGDALFDPYHPGAVDAVLAATLRHPRLAGATILEGWFPPRPDWWHDRLVGLGMERARHPDDLTLICGPHGHPHPERLLAEAYYTMGDGDLF